MSTRYNNGSHYENQQREKEWMDGAAHAHRVGALNGKQDHLTGLERTREAMEHAMEAHAYEQALAKHSQTHALGKTAFGHDEIAALAVELWRVRGCPDGSPEEDWNRAVAILRSGMMSH